MWRWERVSIGSFVSLAKVGAIFSLFRLIRQGPVVAQLESDTNKVAFSVATRVEIRCVSKTKLLLEASP